MSGKFSEKIMLNEPVVRRLPLSVIGYGEETAMPS